MELVITLIISLLLSFLFTLLTKKLKFSIVVGLILAGLVIGLPSIRDIILEPNINFILTVGDFGLISLMFLAGLETSGDILYKEKKDIVIIASFGDTLPFLLGFLVFLALGFSLATSIIIGICMSITAEATQARVLLELDMLKTKIGALLMGSGIFDDTIGILLFIGVSYWLVEEFATKELMILILTLTAFFIGIIVNRTIGRTRYGIQYLEKSLMLIIVPFFFIGMGIHFDFQSLILAPFILLTIITVAVVGKLAGALLTKPFTKLSFRQLHLIGWGMNSRGAIEIALAIIAFKLGLFSVDLYSSLIIMALFTTLIFPFIIRRMIKKEPTIMN